VRISKRLAFHWVFDAAVAIKAIDGVLEIAGGSFLLFKPGWIGPAIGTWAGEIPLDHPASRLAQIVNQWGDGLSADTEHFASAYLIAHGVAKVFIAWGLIREKLWAFPTALGVFGLLIAYQIYRVAHTHSVTLGSLIVLDIAVCYVIWREWGFRKDVEPSARR
jgi:uncharacterized membrane protein